MSFLRARVPLHNFVPPAHSIYLISKEHIVLKGGEWERNHGPKSVSVTRSYDLLFWLLLE